MNLFHVCDKLSKKGGLGELNNDVHKKVNNFFKALNNIKEIVGKEPPFDPITEAGMVSLFEICFEQS